MILEKQVISLEIAKKLCDLGFNEESKYGWYVFHTTGKSEIFNVSGKIQGDDTGLSIMYCAYTVAELGEILPAQLKNNDPGHPIHQYISEKQFSRWHSVYVCSSCMGKLGSQIADTEADSRGKMLIYLIENKLI